MVRGKPISVYAWHAKPDKYRFVFRWYLFGSFAERSTVPYLLSLRRCLMLTHAKCKLQDRFVVARTTSKVNT